MNKENALLHKLIACIRERRLPWRIYYPLFLLKKKIGLIPEGGDSYSTMDSYVEEQLRKIKPKTVVDFGAGKGKYGRLLRKNFGNNVYIVAIEIFRKTAKFLKRQHIYNRIIYCDLRTWFNNNTEYYDVAIFGDVLEHLNNENEIYSVLDLALNQFRNIIIVVPLGEYKQESIGANIYEVHRVTLNQDFFDKFNIMEKNIKQIELPPNVPEKRLTMNVWIYSNKDPLISIIMPTYNREKLLSRAINSVLNQTYQNWELIIVDDRSTDNTEGLVKEYMEQNQRIRYVKNTHKQGPAGARNQGIEIAKGEYIAFLDSDDEWKDWHLKEIIDEFEKNTDIDWIYADCEISRDGKIIEKSVFKEEWKGKDKFVVEKRGNLSVLNGNNLLTNALSYGTYAGCQVSVVRRRLFDKIRFDESFYFGGVEDRLTPLETVAANFRLAYIDKIHLTRYIHKDSISASITEKPIADRLNIYKELEKLYKTIPVKISLTKKQRRIVNNMLANLYFWQIGYNCYLQMKDYKKTKEYFLRAIRLNPLNLKYWKTYTIRILLRMH